MSIIYLIRHGQSETQEGPTCCIGRGSNPSLSENGRKQSGLLAECFDGIAIDRVYYSTLKRSRETAEILSGGKLVLCPLSSLDEIDMGEWEGLSFSEIRMKYPDIYNERGKDWSICPPDGENLESAAERIESTLKEIAGNGDNNILVVTHDGLIRALLWSLLKLNTKQDAMVRQPFGSLTVLKYENGTLTVTARGKLPNDYPTDEEIHMLWNICGTPESVRDHSYAVCEKSLEIWEQMYRAGVILSREQLRAASLLHDMCRPLGRDHPYKAAEILRERGYLKVARIVEQHHGGTFKDDIDETQILFLADKLIQGTKPVTIEERFEASIKKCKTQEAVENHKARYQQAMFIQDKINRKMG